MKLHDLRPAAGAHTKKTRVGRGIAAGKGKTAGRGTKGQKSRAGSSIPPWFEGGQTPLHIRIPKLRGFRNVNRIEYEVVNVGRISAAAETGRLPEGEKGAPIAVDPGAPPRWPASSAASTSRSRSSAAARSSRPLFVVADAFTKSAREKIEAAGGSVQLLEIPSSPLAALGVEPAARRLPPRRACRAGRGCRPTSPPRRQPPAGDDGRRDGPRPPRCSSPSSTPSARRTSGGASSSSSGS